VRTKIKTERHKQRKMMSERRTMVDNMVKYTTDRNARMQAHKDRLMAARGDLNAEQEDQLRTAAGTIDALRMMNETSSRAALSFEEKCKEAFTQIENLTGASDISEVLHLVTSKHELTSQLNRRVKAVQERINVLTEERGTAEEQLTDAMYGAADDV